MVVQVSLLVLNHRPRPAASIMPRSILPRTQSRQDSFDQSREDSRTSSRGSSHRSGSRRRHVSKAINIRMEEKEEEEEEEDEKPLIALNLG